MPIIYTNDFYARNKEEIRRSAERIVPIIINLIPCKKVVDVGCGSGIWLKVFQEYGVKEILGIDGDHITSEILVIPNDNFIPVDLENPLPLNQEFDLVISLEVAEHISVDRAGVFIDYLASLGKVVLFSAAIPHQGGRGHINEQWPDYWSNLFQEKDYVVIDCLRNKIWNNSDIAYYYRQNIFLFVQRTYLKSNFSQIQIDTWISNGSNCISVVHPGLYIDTTNELLYTKMELMNATNPENISLMKTLKILPKIIINAYKRRIKSFYYYFTHIDTVTNAKSNSSDGSL